MYFVFKSLGNAAVYHTPQLLNVGVRVGSRAGGLLCLLSWIIYCSIFSFSPSLNRKGGMGETSSAVKNEFVLVAWKHSLRKGKKPGLKSQGSIHTIRSGAWMLSTGSLYYEQSIQSIILCTFKKYECSGFMLYWWFQLYKLHMHAVSISRCPFCPYNFHLPDGSQSCLQKLCKRCPVSLLHQGDFGLLAHKDSCGRVHNITERLQWEGTSRGCLVQPLCSGQSHLQQSAQC